MLVYLPETFPETVSAPGTGRPGGWQFSERPSGDVAEYHAQLSRWELGSVHGLTHLLPTLLPCRVCGP